MLAESTYSVWIPALPDTSKRQNIRTSKGWPPVTNQIWTCPAKWCDCHWIEGCFCSWFQWQGASVWIGNITQEAACFVPFPSMLVDIWVSLTWSCYWDPARPGDHLWKQREHQLEVLRVTAKIAQEFAQYPCWMVSKYKWYLPFCAQWVVQQHHVFWECCYESRIIIYEVQK